MSATEWVEQILALPDTAARRRLVQQHASALDDDVAIRLKEQADRFLESEVHRSLEIAELLLLAAELTNNPLYFSARPARRGQRSFDRGPRRIQSRYRTIRAGRRYLLGSGRSHQRGQGTGRQGIFTCHVGPV